MIEILLNLHQTYVHQTGMDLNFKLFERDWYEFVKAGFGADDLELVIRHLQKLNKKQEFKHSLRLSKVIRDLARFDEWRAEAAAVKRNQRPTLTNKEKIVEQWRPKLTPEPVKDSTTTVREVFKKILGENL